MAGGAGKGSRKVGRHKRKAINLAYKANGRRLRNKELKLIKHTNKNNNDSVAKEVLTQLAKGKYTPVPHSGYKKVVK